MLLSIAKHVNNTIKNQTHAKVKSLTVFTITNPPKHLKTYYLEEISSETYSTFIKKILRQLLGQTSQFKILKTLL